MATTRIMPLHVGKGRTESRAISDIIDYVANPKKTDNGRLITGYACDLSLIHISFIHEANTEVRKKELFSKVRTGQVRVLMGSTAKMGAGTNVQDRLVALHDLDCPWRPGDLAQRKGRIERPVSYTHLDVYKRQVLAHGLMDEADKQQISTLLQSGRSNSEIAYWLSRDVYKRQRSSCLINPVCSPMGGLPVIICRRAFIAMTCAVLTMTPESRSV